MSEATETTGNYIHFRNDTNVAIDVYVYWGAKQQYTTHLTANGGTGTPYKPFWQKRNYSLFFYLESGGPSIASCQPANVQHKSKLGRVFTEGGEFNCTITNF